MMLMKLGMQLIATVLAGLAAFSTTADAADPTHVLVVNTQDASISLVELAGMTEVRRIPVGPRPYGIAVTADGKRVAVGVEGEGKVKFLDTTTFEVEGQAPIGKMHNDHIILSADGMHILVASFTSDDILGIEAATMKEAFRIEGTSAPHVIKYGPLRRNAYVTCKKITGIALVEPTARKLAAFHQINVNPRSLTFSDDETKLYFASFWVDGFFEMETGSGKVTRLFVLDPPEGRSAPREVTYHGVESVGNNVVLAANEGRSYVDSVDVNTGKLLDRLTDVSSPCCIERIPGSSSGPVRVLVSNIGDGTLQLVEVSREGKLRSIAKAQVGKGPKRVGFLTPSR
jgi:DNA-binding beta-propeller fold protein YncE